MRYVPGPMPIDAPAWTVRELQSISQASDAPSPFSMLQELHNEPQRPRDGMIAVADGTDWDPGSGAGLYFYQAGAWHMLSGTGGGLGTVTSVAATVPSIFSIAGSPITTSGTLAMTYSGTALPVANGGTGDTSLTAYAPLFGGTTSTGAIQSGTVGTTGHVLTSNGAGAIATFQAVPDQTPLTTKGDLFGFSSVDARIPVGTNDYVLTADSSQALGVKWAPASGGSGTKTYAVFTPMTSQPPATNYATLDTRNSIAVLDFDANTSESIFWVGIIPEGASLGSGLIVKIHWMATSATALECRWGAAFERMTTDLDSDSFDTETTGESTTSGTSGIITVTSLTCTTIDGVTAGDAYRLKITRKLTGLTGTNIASDVELVCVEVRSAA